MGYPALQQFRGFCFHDLETARAVRLHPARVVADPPGKHSAILLEALANKRGASRLESFKDHEEHVPEFTPRAKQFSMRKIGPSRIVSPLIPGGERREVQSAFASIGLPAAFPGACAPAQWHQTGEPVNAIPPGRASRRLHVLYILLDRGIAMVYNE